MNKVKITTLINSFQNFQLIFNPSSEIRIPQSEIEKFWDSFFNFKKRYWWRPSGNNEKNL